VALHRPDDERGGRIRVGLLQSIGCAGIGVVGGPRMGAEAGRRTYVRARDDKKNALRGMVARAWCGARGRGAGASDLHADRRLQTSLRRVRRQTDAHVRRQLNAMDLRHLEWPFFDPAHRALAQRALEWDAPPAAFDGDIDLRCRSLVTSLGEAGLLRYCVPASNGGALPSVESRSLCLLREALASREGLADFAFAMQGLGSGAITLAGSEAQRARWLPLVGRGEAIAAFALSEPEAGSDVGAIATRARRDGNGWVIDG